MIFETHAHYDDHAFDSDREALMASLSKQGIGRIVNVCSGLESLTTTIQLAKQYPFVYAAVGLHPDEVGGLNDEVMERMHSLCHLPKTVAVGEIGLDYHWMVETKENQERWFRAQLCMAREEHLPVIIHSREAAADTLTICKSEHLEQIGGVMHCFSYEKEMAREYLNMGIYLGIGGVITYKNARKLVEVVEYAPMDRILLETDCPYLSPQPNRGKRNSSLNLTYVAEKIGQIKGLTGEDVIAACYENARTLFGIA